MTERVKMSQKQRVAVLAVCGHHLEILSFPFLLSSEGGEKSVLQRAANRIKQCKVGAVSPFLTFDPISALFYRPGLKEQQCCTLNGAFCHVCVQ